MQVWNLLHAARWKHRTQKSRQKSPSGHHCTTLSGYIFATKACIDNQKKLVKQQYVLYMSPQYAELRHTSGWDRFTSLGHPTNFNGFRVLAALLHGSQIVSVSQTLRCWTEGATYVRQGNHHVGHWPTFLLLSFVQSKHTQSYLTLHRAPLLPDIVSAIYRTTSFTLSHTLLLSFNEN